MQEVSLKREIIEKLSHRGVMAYVAVSLAGDIEASTAALAGLVRAQTAVMLEGLKELAVASPTLLRQPKKGKWQCGDYKPTGLAVVQNLDSSRYVQFTDDLKKYWDHLNPTLPFTMGAADGAAIRSFLADHREWTRDHWRMALINRGHSPVAKSAPLFTWVRKLGEYAAGALDQFGKPVEGGGKHGQAIGTETANRAAREAAIRSRKKG